MILTASEVTVYSNISASAGTIASLNLVEVAQARLCAMLNNYFTTDLAVTDLLTFDASARTVVASTNSFDDWNFLAGDDIYVYGSYRNDGFYTLLTVSSKTLTLATGATVVAELSGRSCYVSVVKYPLDLKMVVARMCAYDYDVRPSRSNSIKSRSLGPLSESYGDGNEDQYGYPRQITAAADPYRIARAM